MLDKLSEQASNKNIHKATSGKKFVRRSRFKGDYYFTYEVGPQRVWNTSCWKRNVKNCYAELIRVYLYDNIR